MLIDVFGANGMLGHVVVKYLKTYHEIRCVTREQIDVENITEHDLETYYCNKLKPNIIINCVGVLVKQSNHSPLKAININSRLPHILKNFADVYNIKIIHASTDCVFSGLNGPYTSKRQHDGLDVYSKSKSLGEIGGNHLTIRTSIIGPELSRKEGLFEWFMLQQKECDGYVSHFWNGLTTLEWAKFVLKAIENNECGILQVSSSDVVSKFDILTSINEIYSKNVIINKKKTNEIYKVLVPDLCVEKTVKDMIREQYDWYSI